MNAIWEGYLVGLAMIIFIGPVFFTLLKSTLHYGTRFGFALAIGILASDLMIVFLCSTFSTNFLLNSQLKLFSYLLGSIVLLSIGIKYILKPSLVSEVHTNRLKKNLLSAFCKGFLVNTINPFVFIVWMGTIAYAESKYVEKINVQLFIGSALLGILTTDVFKVILSGKLKKYLSPQFLKKIFLFIGIILISFGIRLLYLLISN